MNMTDYSKEPINILRLMARRWGWKNPDIKRASRQDLICYLKTGQPPPLRHYLDGNGCIALSRSRVTPDELLSVAIVHALPLTTGLFLRELMAQLVAAGEGSHEG